jgi:molecular chaperone GrpE
MKGSRSVPTTAAQLVMRHMTTRGVLQQQRPGFLVSGRFVLVAKPTITPSNRSLWSSNNMAVSTSLQQPMQPLFSCGPLERQSRCFSDKAEATEKEQQQEAPSAEQDSAAAASAEEATTPPPPTVSREEELEQRVKALENLHLRALAEQENIRRIAARDVEASKQFAIKSFAKSLLDTSDNLTRALEAVPEDKRHDKTKNEEHAILANLYEGIEMTQRELNKAFAMNGLHKFGSVGDVFDPNKHQALFEYVDAEKEAGTIGQIMKPGFMLRDRVLRPAEVGVVKSG